MALVGGENVPGGRRRRHPARLVVDREFRGRCRNARWLGYVARCRCGGVRGCTSQ